MHKEELTLYGTDNCHLCEYAEDMISQAISNLPYTLKIIDILEHSSFTKYEMKIPVLCGSLRIELCWPFTLEEIITWLHLES
jgi:hypothetical protein